VRIQPAARTLGLWGGVAAAVVLAGRWLSYALAPASPLTRELSGQTGGPRLIVIAIAAPLLALAGAAGLLLLAAAAVRERQRLRPDASRLAAPPLRAWPVLARAAALWLASSLVFALLESAIHYHQGLGFHGLHCLLGPVHRDALPILGALSLVAAACVAALGHIVRWMRRTAARITRALRTGARLTLPVVTTTARPLAALAAAPTRSRAPPAPAR
jgi:hypothetical protein